MFDFNNTERSHYLTVSILSGHGKLLGGYPRKIRATSRPLAHNL